MKNFTDGYNNILLNVVKPYNFTLSLRVSQSFIPTHPVENEELVLAVKIGGIPALVEIYPDAEQKNSLIASSTFKVNKQLLRELAEWVLCAELELAPFYSLMRTHPKLGAIILKLYGLKPIRPPTLFEMAVTVITEQQISLVAAHQIRTRLIQRFGEEIDSRWIFPGPDVLAKAPIDLLRSVGLSLPKAQYIKDLASKVSDSDLNLDNLKKMDDDKARQKIMSLRGFGRWSADYILIRGLARLDSIPVDDLGVRRIVGEYLGSGQRASPEEVTEKLEPFRPYRGLLIFYLFAARRLGLLNN
jgi:3-methyladenine DNA glycosylase/8-oxoguanine DNA glycosylase